MAPELTTKQQRDARRAEKVAALKKRQANEKRSRVIWISLLSTIAVGLVAAIVAVVVTSGGSTPTPVATGPIKGLLTYADLEQTHVDQDDDASNDEVDYADLYGMIAPAGGPHWAGWLNCGVYDEPQQSERAVHVLEHGGVWVTYNPDEVSADDLATLRDSLPDTYIVLSPYPGLSAPVVASAWGAQVPLDGVDDSRLAQFIAAYWQSPDSPEPGAPCTGGIDGPGKVS